jgi:hypothetical protein
MKFQEPKAISKEEVEAAIDRCDPEELLEVPISVSMYEQNPRWAQLVCLGLSAHAHPVVRGNAVLGFGHLARRFGKLDFEDVIIELIEDALHDPDEYVRDQANAAADDVECFLSCRINRESKINQMA